MTDQDGKIILGALIDIIGLKARVKEHLDILTVERTWFIDEMYETRIRNLPPAFRLIEGEKLEIPFLAEKHS